MTQCNSASHGCVFNSFRKEDPSGLKRKKSVFTDTGRRGSCEENVNICLF